jgi:hypothetical protein
MPSIVPAGDRTAKWDLKYDPKRIDDITTAGKPTYLTHVSAVFANLEDMELRTKQVVNGLGLPVQTVASYLSFARQVWKAQQTHHGETLAIEAQILIDKWVARSLVQSALEKIRKDVFDINPPVTP